MRQHTFAIIVGLLLFFIPFFWLKPGEMNLGGDAGRLYFYDPAAYLDLQVFYNYVRSGTGGEVVNYVYLPYVTVLFLLKHIFRSPTILISLFNGLTLSVGFFSAYLIVKELLSWNENNVRLRYIKFASILAGLFYILSQLSIYSGWERPIITHSQIFLNPLMTLLILKFMLTQKVKYLTLALLTTFIFTSNFAFIGAPPFFAFYPITILFLFLYAKFIRRTPFSYKLFALGITLFLLIHAFHLVNEVGAIFSLGSSYSRTIFTQEGEGSREGLNYFISVASNIKVSLIWMSLAQFQKEPWFAIFIIFPTALVASLFLNRGKTLLLTGIFFLILLYFTSAITETGFFIYKLLFRIPGFSMFRNFHAQWSYAFFFFYALLFGQALAIIVNKLSKWIAFLLFTIVGAIIIGFGLPLLTGAVPVPTYRDTGVRYAFRMDPIYEQVLQYFRADPIDGRVLVFPLTSNGYQILQGKDGGLYQGLPTISYILDKSELGGYETLRPFQDVFLTSMHNNDYETLKKLLSVMNVRQVFYNSDPYIYNDSLKPYLYDYVSRFTPKDQEAYKAFIEKLPLTKVTDFGNAYHVYSINDDNVYLPHIFTTKSVTYTNNTTDLIVGSNNEQNLRQTVLPIQSAIDEEDAMAIYGLPKTFLTKIRNNSHFHKHEPFLNRKLNDISYFFTVLKEKFDLIRAERDPQRYLDTSLLLLTKRNLEMIRFGVDMGIRQESWKEPPLWGIYNWQPYNSWDASLARYEKAVLEIIDWVEKDQTSYEQRIVNRIKINEQLYQHEIELLRELRTLHKKKSEKEYLLSFIKSMYERLYQKIQIPISDPSLYTYRLPAYAHSAGTYEVYLGEDNTSIKDTNQIAITFEDKIVKPVPESAQNGLLRFADDIRLDGTSDTEATLTMPIVNLANGVSWSSSGFSTESVDGTTTMVLNNKLGDFTEGLTLEIPNWIPRNVYLVSFDYDTSGEDFIFSFVDKRPIDDPTTKAENRILFKKRLNTKEFKTHQSIVFSEIDSTGGSLKISPVYLNLNDTSTIKIRNLIVQKVDYPQLVFKKIVPETSASQPPHVTFTRINPTKYSIDIKGARSPYTLVFLESFNSNWELVDPNVEDKTTGGRLLGAFGRLERAVTGLFVKDITNEKGILASYFNGEVKEGVHTNSFLTPSTFETWGKKTIADTTHTQAFEYANAWFIKPEDLDGKTDYRLILELKTQQWFYPALLVSLVTVVCLLIYSLGKILLWLRKR